MENKIIPRDNYSALFDELLYSYDVFDSKCKTGDCPMIDSFWEDGGYGESAIVLQRLLEVDFIDKFFDLNEMHNELKGESFKKAEDMLKGMGFEKYIKDIKIISYVTEY